MAGNGERLEFRVSSYGSTHCRLLLPVASARAYGQQNRRKGSRLPARHDSTTPCTLLHQEMMLDAVTYRIIMLLVGTVAIMRRPKQDTAGAPRAYLGHCVEIADCSSDRDQLAPTI